MVTGHDLDYMRLALDRAREARDAGEVPVGAVVVMDGKVVGSGHNASIARTDPTAHAEIVALRDAASRIGNYRLVGATVYCTVEPCLMCLGAMLHSRIGRLVYGAAESRVGATGRLQAMWDTGNGINHRFEIVGSVLPAEASDLLLEFFQERRGRPRQAEAASQSGGEVPKWS